MPFAISLILTPFALFIGLVSAGAGHGNYILAILLFPFTLLALILVAHPAPSNYDVWLFGSAAAQFPMYGILFSLIGRKKLLTSVIALIHTFLFVVIFYLARKWDFV
jgi:hypothetical protein